MTQNEPYAQDLPNVPIRLRCFEVGSGQEWAEDRAARLAKRAALHNAADAPGGDGEVG